MRLAVVGGVAAGLSAASRARRLDRSLDIVVLEKGSRISYGACGLPYWIEGQVSSLDEITLHTPEFFERERNIQVRTESEVVEVRHPARELLLRCGERVRYDRLIWAAGARPATSVAGPNIFCLQTDRDAERLHEFLATASPRNAAVVGGGYIGLELATALRARGLSVTLYHDRPHLLDREEDWLTKVITDRLERSRVEIRLNTAADPASLPHGLVLVSTGLRPNVEILAAAGAELGRTGALRVSEHAETNLGGVYAAGDCCETQHLVSRRPVWLPLGTTANKMGRVAGANAAGRRERFEGITGTSIVRVAGLAVATTGLSQTQARRDGFSPVSTRIEALDRPLYFRGRKMQVELIGDRLSRLLLGAAIAGDEGVLARINVCATALAARMKVEEFASVDLAYSPPYATVMDPLLVAAQQLLKLLD